MVGILRPGKLVAPAFKDLLGIRAHREGLQVGGFRHPLLVETRRVHRFLDVHLVVDDIQDRQHDLELGDLMLTVFNRHFEVPTLPNDVDVFALALELSDRVYARSVHQHGLITPRMAEEGMRVFDAYVGLYLPAYLPKRASSQASQLPH